MYIEIPRMIFYNMCIYIYIYLFIDIRFDQVNTSLKHKISSSPFALYQSNFAYPPSPRTVTSDVELAEMTTQSSYNGGEPDEAHRKEGLLRMCRDGK